MIQVLLADGTVVERDIFLVMLAIGLPDNAWQQQGQIGFYADEPVLVMLEGGERVEHMGLTWPGLVSVRVLNHGQGECVVLPIEDAVADDWRDRARYADDWETALVENWKRGGRAVSTRFGPP